MTLREKAEWLNKFDERQCRNWGVIRTNEVEVLGQIGSQSAYVVPPTEIVFILLGEIKTLVKRGEANKLCTEIFEVFLSLLPK